MERDEDNAINVRVKTVDGRSFDFLLRPSLSVERFKTLIFEVSFRSPRKPGSLRTGNDSSSAEGCCWTACSSRR